MSVPVEFSQEELQNVIRVLWAAPAGTGKESGADDALMMRTLRMMLTQLDRYWVHPQAVRGEL